MLLNVILLKQQRQISVIFSLLKTLPLLLKPPILILLFYPGFLLSVKICPYSGMCFSTLSQCSWLDFTKKRLSWGNHFWLDRQQREVLTGPSLQRVPACCVMLGSSSRSRTFSTNLGELQCVSSWREAAPVCPAPVNPGLGILASISSWEAAQMGELWRMSNRSCEGINEGRIWVLNMHFLVKEWQRGILFISPYYRAANFKEGKTLFHTVTRYKTRINGVKFNKGKCKLSIFQIRD